MPQQLGGVPVPGLGAPRAVEEHPVLLGKRVRGAVYLSPAWGLASREKIMDSSDPRIKLLQKWSEEGVLAQAGFVNSAAEIGDEPNQLGAFGGVVSKHREEIEQYKKHLGKTHKQTHKTHNKTFEKNVLLDLLVKKYGVELTKQMKKKHKEHKNKYVHGTWTLEMLQTELAHAKQIYADKIKEIIEASSGHIPKFKLPPEISPEALTTWNSIVQYKKTSGSSFMIPWGKLESLKTKISEVTQNDKVKYNLFPPKNHELLPRNIGEGLLVARFLKLVAKFIQVNKKDPTYRQTMGYAAMKRFSRELAHLKNLLTQVEQGIEKRKKG